MLGVLCYWTLGLELTATGLGRWMRGTVAPGLMPLLITAPVYFGTPHLFAVDSGLLLACHVAIGSAAYGVVMFLFCDAEEQADLRRILSKVRQLTLGAGH